jgi:hypothetical protein
MVGHANSASSAVKPGHSDHAKGQLKVKIEYRANGKSISGHGAMLALHSMMVPRRAR